MAIPFGRCLSRFNGEVCFQHALKLANVDLAYPSLFLYLLQRLGLPCIYLIGCTIPTSLLVLVENIFTPLVILRCCLLLLK